MKKKVLVIENDKSIREFITYLLVDEGYDILSVDTEIEVFIPVESYGPDVILLDIIKPSDIGTQICEALKENQLTKHIPVIVLSTHFRIVDFITDCADEVVSKPFDISKLIEIIEKQIEAE